MIFVLWIWRTMPRLPLFNGIKTHASVFHCCDDSHTKFRFSKREKNDCVKEISENVSERWRATCRYFVVVASFKWPIITEFISSVCIWALNGFVHVFTRSEVFRKRKTNVDSIEMTGRFCLSKIQQHFIKGIVNHPLPTVSVLSKCQTIRLNWKMEIARLNMVRLFVGGFCQGFQFFSAMENSRVKHLKLNQPNCKKWNFYSSNKKRFVQLLVSQFLNIAMSVWMDLKMAREWSFSAHFRLGKFSVPTMSCQWNSWYVLDECVRACVSVCL